jgi:hypothetical protein
MAFSSSIVQPVAKPHADHPTGNDMGAPLLSMLILSVYGAQKSKKAFRKMKRQFMWTTFKLKLKSMFSRKADISNRTLIYILLGVVLLALLFIEPVLALVVAVILLILLLAGVI